MIDADIAHARLQLNPIKFEIVATNFDRIKDFSHIQGLQSRSKADRTILGASILKGSAVDKALEDKISELKRVLERLSLLHEHYALCLLRNALAMPKLLYISYGHLRAQSV